MLAIYLIEVTSHPLSTPYLHILDPKNPLPPHTMSFLADMLSEPSCNYFTIKLAVVAKSIQMRSIELSCEIIMCLDR